MWGGGRGASQRRSLGSGQLLWAGGGESSLVRAECVEITADHPWVEAGGDAAIGFLPVGRRTSELRALGLFCLASFRGGVGPHSCNVLFSPRIPQSSCGFFVCLFFFQPSEASSSNGKTRLQETELARTL